MLLLLLLCCCGGGNFYVATAVCAIIVVALVFTSIYKKPFWPPHHLHIHGSVTAVVVEDCSSTCDPHPVQKATMVTSRTSSSTKSGNQKKYILSLEKPRYAPLAMIKVSLLQHKSFLATTCTEQAEQRSLQESTERLLEPARKNTMESLSW